MRSRFVFLGLLAFAGCVGTPEEAQSALQGGGNYQPVPNAGTACDCMPTNGTCNADCSITCSAGFGDCDANVSNGCETQLNTISNCGQCGHECSCYGGAMCINGACAGTPQPNGTPCSNPGSLCSGGGVCQSLACTCSTGAVDMAKSPPDLSTPTGGTTATGSTTSGSGKSGNCSVGGGSLATMFPIVLALVYLSLRRRRRDA
jgi:MYXO-CTERM domain-containing protein